ncbi:unnamed protein product, partial [Darwinula stevensoni]
IRESVSSRGSGGPARPKRSDSESSLRQTHPSAVPTRALSATRALCFCCQPFQVRRLPAPADAGVCVAGGVPAGEVPLRREGRGAVRAREGPALGDQRVREAPEGERPLVEAGLLVPLG